MKKLKKLENYQIDKVKLGKIKGGDGGSAGASIGGSTGASGSAGGSASAGDKEGVSDSTLWMLWMSLMDALQ